jgi:hypothetical protein
MIKERLLDIYDINLNISFKNKIELIFYYSVDIVNQLSNLGLVIEKAKIDDISEIDTLVSTRYNEELMSETSPFTSYRFVEFGTVHLLKTDLGKIVGCIYEMGMNNEKKTSFAIRLIIDFEFERKGFAQKLSIYSCLAALNSGSNERRGIIELENETSHILHLNKLGWIYDSYINTNLEGVKDHFRGVLDLNQSNPFNKIVSLEKIKSLIKSSIQNIDYKLVKSDSILDIEQSFSENFIIHAFIPKGEIDINSYFFSLPNMN